MARTYSSNRSARTASARHDVRIAQTQRLSPVELLILAVIAALLIASPFLTRQHTGFSGATMSLQVQTGDTLWSIARQHPVAGMTTAQAVELIASANKLSGGVVSPGQTILVPAVEDGDRLAMR